MVENKGRGMNKVTDITVIIPSYNPDDKLIQLIEELKKSGFYNILVVDDGSAKECLPYFQKADELGAQVLKHDVNCGKGRALKTAFEFCLHSNECSGVVTVDGDGQHLVKDIYACVEEMLRKKDKVILGAREFSSAEIPFRSRFGNNLTRMVFKIFCGIDISDTQTGLRVIPRCYLEQFLEYQGERYEYETNMLLMMKRDKIEWEEVKISTVYISENESSHFNPVKDSLKIYKVIFNYWKR